MFYPPPPIPNVDSGRFMIPYSHYLQDVIRATPSGTPFYALMGKENGQLQMVACRLFHPLRALCHLACHCFVVDSTHASWILLHLLLFFRFFLSTKPLPVSVRVASWIRVRVSWCCFSIFFLSRNPLPVRAWLVVWIRVPSLLVVASLISFVPVPAAVQGWIWSREVSLSVPFLHNYQQMRGA